jgi:hypothetical protein
MLTTLSECDSVDAPPIFGSLRHFINPCRQTNKMIMIVLKDEDIPRVKEIIHSVAGNLKEPNTGILFTVPSWGGKESRTSNMHTLFYVAIAMIAGLLMTRVVKLVHLPNVTGYLIAGLLIGPYCLKLISNDTLATLDILTVAALGFIAFSIGSEFKLAHIKAIGGKIILITVCEALGAVILVDVVVSLFGFPVPMALAMARSPRLPRRRRRCWSCASTGEGRTDKHAPAGRCDGRRDRPDGVRDFRFHCKNDRERRSVQHHEHDRKPAA